MPHLPRRGLTPQQGHRKRGVPLMRRHPPYSKIPKTFTCRRIKLLDYVSIDKGRWAGNRGTGPMLQVYCPKPGNPPPPPPWMQGPHVHSFMQIRQIRQTRQTRHTLQIRTGLHSLIPHPKSSNAPRGRSPLGSRGLRQPRTNLFRSASTGGGAGKSSGVTEHWLEASWL